MRAAWVVLKYGHFPAAALWEVVNLKKWHTSVTVLHDHLLYKLQTAICSPIPLMGVAAGGQQEETWADSSKRRLIRGRPHAEHVFCVVNDSCPACDFPAAVRQHGAVLARPECNLTTCWSNARAMRMRMTVLNA